jgi:hypothetical protein
MIKILLYFYKDENISLIFRKRTYWEGQSQTPNETNLTLLKKCKDTRDKKNKIKIKGA